MVTDFDFKYGIGAHLVHGVTYVTVPPSSTETELDLGLLTSYAERGEGHKEIPAGIESLVRLARSKTFVKGSSGILFTRCVEMAPDTRYISSLAKAVAYGGTVSCKLRSEGRESELVSSNDSYTPDSRYCLHVRTMWKWKPEASNDSETIGGIPAWELDVQQAMVCKMTDWLANDEISLLENLPVRFLVYNLNIAERDGSKHETRGQGPKAERKLWGCNE